ncbi:LysR family transcriptional regulator [uncultured Roseibium sp.]|uniref:LysR family transcriptional regulator n=1 Tax=uncultured Roseibium sp. TaxID=1936171 RepID=UPI00260926D8|nr:LysR family transcriptional regulator [uncultured Roseibium sp.]
MYSIPDLQTFVAVARYGGITSAAGQLGISAATTSHRITKLEQALTVTLFHRNSRTFRLTDEGQLFLERVDVILEDLQQAEFDVGSGTAKLRGHLRVTMSPWILSRFIMPVLGEFRTENPDLTIEFLAVDRFVPLVEERQDCAIRVGRLADSSLVAQKLCDNDRIICASPSLFGAFGEPDTVEDLRDFPWVCLPWQTRFDVNDAKGRKRQYSVARSIAVSNSDMLTVGAVEGLGLVIKSRMAVREELEAGTLAEVLPGCLHAPEAPIWFVFAAESRTGRKTKAFHEVAKSAFGR